MKNNLALWLIDNSVVIIVVAMIVALIFGLSSIL